MNIKIKSTGVQCLIGDDYDRVYMALTKSLGEGVNNIFTERIPGHEYLQWVLPGDGWVALSQGDPLMAAEVKTILSHRRQILLDKFGSNVSMAQKVLSVPNDDYIFYRADENGEIQTKLTVWGYRYPERIGSTDLQGNLDGLNLTEDVVIQLLNDGQPCASKEFKLNGFRRVTSEDGVLLVGKLPLNYKLNIEVDGKHTDVIISDGNGKINIDCTQYCDVKVIVNKDGNPTEGVSVDIAYGDHHVTVTTGVSGNVTSRMPLSLSPSVCVVSVENETQQQYLASDAHTFTFNLLTPITDEPPVVDEPPVIEKPAEVNEILVTDEPPVVDEPPVIEKPADINESPATDEPPVVDEPPIVEEQKKTSLLTILAFILLLALLVVLTFAFCTGILFG